MPPSSSVGAGRSRSMCSSTHGVGRPSVNSRGVMLFRTSPVNITTERPAFRRSVIGSAFYPHGNPRPLSELLNPHTPASNSSTPRPAAAAATNSSSNTPGITAKLHPAAAAIAAADARRAAASAAGPLPRPMPYGMPRGTPLAHNTLSAVATAPGPAAAAAPHPFTAAPLYEAFEPGDSGFFSPTTAEIVTSSSGSVMVQVCAHFNGQPGDKVLVCGATRVMGNWEPDAAPSLTWSEGDVWTATLELPAGTHEFKSVAIKPIGPPVWEPGNNRRVSVPRGGSLASSSGDEHDGGLGLHDGDGGDGHPDAQLVETSGGTTMVKLTTTYTAAFGEYLKVVGDCPELGSWDAGAAPALTWGEGDVWTATLELPAGEHEFKYVVVRQDGRLEWEPGENRRIHVPLPGLAAALAAAKKVAAAEEAVAAANGSGKPPAAGRKLSAAEVYQRQEAEQRLELWQENLPQYKQQQQQSDPALVPTNGRSGSSSGAVTPTAKPVPADWREVKFSTKFAAEFGTFLKVVGGPDQLGAWDVDAAPPLQWSEGDMWSITLLLPPGTHQFKLVVVNPSGTSEWEAGPNRTFEVMPALTTAEQAAGVLQAECLYGATHATGSIWASLEEDEEHLDQHARAAAEAAAAVVEMHRQQQQQEQQQQLEQQMQPEDWYQQQQELAEKAAAAVAAAEAAAQQQMELSAEAAAAAAAEEVVPAKPAKPLQPLDAVVKVFKDRFAASSAATSPAASPTASMEEEQQLLPEPVTQQQQDVKQQQQQQPAQQQPEVQQVPQQPEEPQEQQQQQPVGDRFAAIIAARRQQQQQSAILFVDKQQPQTQQPSDKPQEQKPLEQQRKPPQKPSSSSGGGNWFDEALASTRGRQQQPQQQQQQRAPTPPWELQPDESASSGLPPLSTDDSSSGQQQLQQPERFASQIKQIRSRPSSPPPRAAAAVPPAADFRVRPPWEQTDDHTADTSTSRTDAEQKQAKPTTTSEAPARSQQQQAAHTPQQKPPSSWQSTKDEQPAVSSSSSSWRTNWRSQSQPADSTPAAPSPADDSSGAPGGRFAAYCAQQDTKPAPASSSSSEGRPASPSWRAPSTPVQQAADAPATRSSAQSAASTDAKPAASSSSSDRWSGYSWRSSSPVQPDSSSSSTEATSSSSTPSSSSSSSSVSSESSSDSRFSKYTSGASWRSSAPQPTQKQPEQQQQQQQQQAPRGSWRSSPQQQQQQREQQQSQPKQSQQPASKESASGGRFANYIQGRAEGSSSSSRQPSSWSAAEASGVGGDYLYQLGQSDYNTNVDAGQNVAMIDSLFTGNVLGHKTDIADGSLRGWEVRTLNNIIGDYYIAPKFMDRVAMHITKNYLCDVGALSKTAKVPLILGIWGPKGCGKTFQTELAFKQLGVEPVVLSAGELESETAGQPGRLIRERYRKAAELSKTRGKLSCLLINDLDAGIGRFGNTQVTVNNQIVIGTLMNICDNPNRVSIGAGWRENDEIKRVPIIVTGNDFSTLYAPLIRDGRMEKFYWQPEREDIVNIVFQMYRDDGLSRRDIESLVDTFSHQALDFFGALRAATYDGQIRDWMASVAGAPLYAADESRVKEVNKRLLSQTGVPEFEPLPLTLDMLLAEGRRLVAQQEAVNNSKLGELYMKGVVWGEAGADAWSSSEVDD